MFKILLLGFDILMISCIGVFLSGGFLVSWADRWPLILFLFIIISLITLDAKRFNEHR